MMVRTNRLVWKIVFSIPRRNSHDIWREPIWTRSYMYKLKPGIAGDAGFRSWAARRYANVKKYLKPDVEIYKYTKICIFLNKLHILNICEAKREYLRMCKAKCGKNDRETRARNMTGHAGNPGAFFCKLPVFPRFFTFLQSSVGLNMI